MVLRTTTKLFDTRKLLAHITVQLRNRQNFAIGNKLFRWDIGIEPATMFVCNSQRNYRIMEPGRVRYPEIIHAESHQVLAKGILLVCIIMDVPDCMERLLKQHIFNLCKKLEDAGNKDYIETVGGLVLAGKAKIPTKF